MGWNHQLGKKPGKTIARLTYPRIFLILQYSHFLYHFLDGSFFFWGGKSKALWNILMPLLVWNRVSRELKRKWLAAVGFAGRQTCNPDLVTLISDGWGSQGWWLVVGGPVRRLLNTGARYRLGRKGLFRVTLCITKLPQRILGVQVFFTLLLGTAGRTPQDMFISQAEFIRDARGLAESGT